MTDYMRGKGLQFKDQGPERSMNHCAHGNYLPEDPCPHGCVTSPLLKDQTIGLSRWFFTKMVFQLWFLGMKAPSFVRREIFVAFAGSKFVNECRKVHF